jgi:hypothetical protein
VPVAIAALILAVAPAPSPAAKPRAPLTDAQFCAFAREIARTTRPSPTGAGTDADRLDGVRADCGARRVIWIETAAHALAARQVGGMNANWNRFMCGSWPFLGAVQRGWTLMKRVRANGRVYEATARCRPA